MRVLIVLSAILGTGAASAQGYIINTPGQQPTFLNDLGGGYYSLNPPGQQPTMIVPQGGGSYTINTPGQMPTYVTPNGPAPLLPQPFPRR